MMASAYAVAGSPDVLNATSYDDSRLDDEGSVAIIHDHVAQRGGGERLLIELMKAFPNSLAFTSVFAPDRTYPSIDATRVRSMAMSRVKWVQNHHRAALPLLPFAYPLKTIDADVSICSSSGWAHCAHVRGRKIVYWHSPNRWIYSANRYLRDNRAAVRAGMHLAGPALRRWDRAGADSAELHLANSSEVQRRLRILYGIEATVLHPPLCLDVHGRLEVVPGLDAGFLLLVSRLLPYKNVRAVVEAMNGQPIRLVVVGDGPDLHMLRLHAPNNVVFVPAASDAQLRWLYQMSAALVAPAYEDFGMTPVEAAAFGKPTLALRWGGYLDSVIEGENGLFFDVPDAPAIVEGLRRLLSAPWDADMIRNGAGSFEPAAFRSAIRGHVDYLAPRRSNTNTTLSAPR